MAISFNKKENEKKKQQKKLDKQKRKEERKEAGKSSFDDMIAYVDSEGNITSTPPELQDKEDIDQEDIIISTPKKEKEEEAILRGRVEHYNESKGFGFIVNLENNEKYFFHISMAPANIAEGNIVTFTLEKGNRGMNAVNIELV